MGSVKKDASQNSALVSLSLKIIEDEEIVYPVVSCGPEPGVKTTDDTPIDRTGIM